ncbi:MAG: NigD-like N-terminal domain-containing protein [Bacteroidales bacterium]|nr:NigD-like N-terminal domain-containing protein [Bacteroidales bacterium]MCF8397307.1 NigD-like N-terminal domain-containing protein [Bacteroidales bacterium]
MKTIAKIIIISFAIIAMGGSCNEDIVKNKKGLVRDFSGLDGCGLLIELDDGKTIQPFEIIPEFTLKEGQRVKLSYSLMKEVGSTCMKGDIVKIVKIREIN